MGEVKKLGELREMWRREGLRCKMLIYCGLKEDEVGTGGKGDLDGNGMRRKGM